MSKCPKCGAENVAGSKFCDSCGAPLEETVFCPNCGEENEAGTVFCSKCGARIAEAPAENANTADQAEAVPQEAAPEAAPAAKPAHSKMLKWAVLGVFAIVIVIILCSAIFGGKSHATNALLYGKDEQIIFHNIDKNKNSKLFDDDAYDDIDKNVQAGGKYLFYVAKEEDDVVLYRADVSKSKKDPVKIDSDVTEFIATDNGSAVYYLKEGSLYKHNMKDKDKVAGHVSFFLITPDGKNVLYDVEGKGSYVKYGSKDGERICGDGARPVSVSKDFKDIVYLNKGSLYKYVPGKDSKKLESHVDDVFGGQFNTSFYFTTTDEDKEVSTLYYYSGKKVSTVLEKIDEGDIEMLCSRSNGTVALFAASVNGDEKVYIASKGSIGDTGLTEDDAVEEIDITSDGKALYYVAEADEGNGYDLYKASVSGCKMKKAEKYDSEVSSSGFKLAGNSVCYQKEDGLYFNKEQIAEDLSMDSLKSFDKYNIAYYIEKGDDEDERNTLHYYNGKKFVEVEKDVSHVSFTADGQLIYMFDVDSKHDVGELHSYNGKKVTKIDEDVEGFFLIRDPFAMYR